jgi:glycosyltransferase involved in cell wall biosynthesis
LAWADVLILPSKTEGLPGVVLEAAAAGVPSVASRVGGTEEAIIDGETGYLIAAGDVDGFAQALGVIAGDPLRGRTLGEAARKLAAERFRLQDSVEEFGRLLDRVGSDGA